MYYLYILECSDKTLYCGITTSLDRRIAEHDSSTLGAKYTRGRRPVKLVYSRVFDNRSEAQVAEVQIKKLPRQGKLNLIKSS